MPPVMAESDKWIIPDTTNNPIVLNIKIEIEVHLTYFSCKNVQPHVRLKVSVHTKSPLPEGLC